MVRYKTFMRLKRVKIPTKGIRILCFKLFVWLVKKHTSMKFKAHARTENKSQWWRLEVRWCERLILLKVECEEQMKGALPSLPPSKQERRAACSHTTVHGQCFLKPRRTTWWIWPCGISGLPRKSRDKTEQLMKSGLSQLSKKHRHMARLLGCASAAPLYYQRSCSTDS